MSSPAFEGFIVQVLLDRDMRERFLAAPDAVARAAGLSEQEIAALASIDRAGLLMQAESLRRKREAQRRSTPRWHSIRVRHWSRGGQHMPISTLGMRWHSFSPYLLSILRVVAAFLFMQFGTAKWFAFPAAMTPGGGTVPLTSLMGVAAMLETVGGFLLLIGLFTRPVAFILSGQMAVAYFMRHAPEGFWPLMNQGTDAALFSFLWLYISAAGAGPWSLDALRRRGQTGWQDDRTRTAAVQPTYKKAG